MYKLVCIILTVLSTVLSATAQYNSQNLSMDTELLENNTKAVERYTYKNLRLFPIYANTTFLTAHADIGKYTTLREALESRKVRITERDKKAETIAPHRTNDTISEARPVRRSTRRRNREEVQQVQTSNTYSGGGARVNSLYIANVSSDTIYIMAGEVVKGGKQDRVIAHDMVLPPASEPVDISVFCVEHGRWTYKGSDSTSQTFNSYASVSTMKLRKTVTEDKNQQKVWDNVKDITTKNSATTSSGTYTAIADNKLLQNKLEDYQKHFQTMLDGKTNIIGVVVATGEKVVGADMFATPDLFRSQFENLLTSYALEAISNGQAVTIDHQIVSTYLETILSQQEGARQDDMIEQNGSLFKHKKHNLRITTY